jgi:hypothetical protein
MACPSFKTDERTRTWRVFQGPWRQVTQESRNVYALAATLFAVSKWNHALAVASTHTGELVHSSKVDANTDAHLAEIVRELDMVLLLSGDPTYALGPFVQRLHDSFKLPSTKHPSPTTQTQFADARNDQVSAATAAATREVGEQVARVAAPDLSWFKTNAMATGYVNMH